MDDGSLSTEDAVLLREMVSAMKDDQVWRTLEDLAKREISLLEDERIGGDPEMRQATLWNAAAMIAAAETFVTQVRTDLPASGTSEGPPGAPRPPGSGPTPSD